MEQEMNGGSVEEREVVRCKRCGLNQYMTRGRNCRLCKVSFDPERAVVVVVNSGVVDDGRVASVRVDLAVMVLRHRLKMTQKELGQRTKTGRTYVSKLEGGKCIYGPTLKTVERFARALKVSERELIKLAMVA